MPTSIPTIGRRIWYWPATLEDDSVEDECLDDDQPYDAGIIFVHPNGQVNLGVTDHEGNYMVQLNVAITEGANEGCAQWMPYQEKQAQKAAEEAKADPNWP